MSDPRRSFRRPARTVAALVLAVTALAAVLPPSAAAAYPTLPVGLDREFLSSLSAPNLSPGSSGTLSYELSDPSGFFAMSDVTLELDVYAFNAFPGNATSSLSTAGAPILVTPTTSGTSANISVGALTPGETQHGSVVVATSASTPTGSFAVRTALGFTANGSAYLLESRGWFTADQWAAATELPNGSTTLNLTVLGVSGVTPETAILVSSSSWDWALAVILGASVALVGAGAFVYFRRAPKSSGGAR